MAKPIQYCEVKKKKNTKKNKRENIDIIFVTQ